MSLFLQVETLIAAKGKDGHTLGHSPPYRLPKEVGMAPIAPGNGYRKDL